MIASSLRRNHLEILKRNNARAYFGESATGIAQNIACLNGEFVLGLNAAGTGTVNLIGVNTSDQVVLAGNVAPTEEHQSFVLDAATAVNRRAYIARIAMQVVAVQISWGVASSSGTFMLEKTTGTTAPGSGTNMLTGTLSTAATANTVTAGALSATVADLQLAAGDCFGFVFSGSESNLVGLAITVTLKPI